MPTPDPTAYNLILAGQYAAANDVIRAGWPQSILDLIQISTQKSATAYQATSGTSVVVGTGTKTFTLSVPHGWPAGTPVYIIAAANPSIVMTGSLTTNETTGGVVTVSVDTAVGSGTFTSWYLMLLKVTNIVASPPLSIAQGGTGGVTGDSARFNFQVGRRRLIDGAVTATPPGSPVIGALYAIKAGGTGVFAGHDGSWATWSGSAWSFETSNVGEESLEISTGLLYSAPATPNDWLLVAMQSPGKMSPIRIGSTPSTLTASQVTAVVSAVVYVVDGSGGALTLPTVASVVRCRLTILNKGAASLTLNVTGGGTMDGATTKVVTSGSRVSLFAYSDGTTTDWLTI